MSKANASDTTPSDKASGPDLTLVTGEGQALAAAAASAARPGRSIRVGDYLVSCALAEAEAPHGWCDDDFVWSEPSDENVHFEVVVRDAVDARFVRGLGVLATLVDEHGRDVGSREQALRCEPSLLCYGRNWTVPGDGTYSLIVRILHRDLPLPRKAKGELLLGGAEITFTDVRAGTT